MNISLSSIWSASLPSALHVTYVCSGFDRLELFLSLYETPHTPKVHRPKYMHSSDCLRWQLFRLAAVAVINSGINHYLPVETIVLFLQEKDPTARIVLRKRFPTCGHDAEVRGQDS